MRFKTKDVVVGIIIIAVVVTAALVYRNLKSPKSLPTPTTSPTIKEMVEGFNWEIPDDVESVELTDVSGGDGRAIATRKYVGGSFSHAVLADLADLSGGAFYEGWLVRGSEGDNNFHFISTGKMRIAKGGYLLEFSSPIDYSDYLGVVITKEFKDDKFPETHILEGSF